MLVSCWRDVCHVVVIDCAFHETKREFCEAVLDVFLEMRFRFRWLVKRKE